MIWKFSGCSRDVPGTSTHLCWARWTEESYSEHWYEKSKNRWIKKMKSRKMKCLKKKKISFLPFFIFHKRSYFFSKLFSKFIECDHALSNSLYLFVYRVLILQGEIWSKRSRITGLFPCTHHAAMRILSLSFIFCIYLICTWAGQCAL